MTLRSYNEAAADPLASPLERETALLCEWNRTLAENARLRTALEVAERDAGLFAATLHMSAQQLGCDTHMVDHAVGELLAHVRSIDGLRDATKDPQ